MGGSERDSTELPQQFGDYSILGHLATGGMAEVYVAHKRGIRGFEKIVVIKRVRPELLGDSVATSHFLDEARLVATLEHPNIAQVYEIGSVNKTYFFVMEYVDGADLRQLMAQTSRTKKRISLADAVYITTHVCAALHYAHEKCDADGHPLNIIHRDVTPSNVLISHTGAIKVCDFGIAKAHGRSLETARGTLKGKFAYMSPEQCRCEQLDRRSDVFAIGILLYELTTTSRLFHRESDFETLRAIADEPIPPPSSRVSGYPKDLERIVMRALRKNPAERYPDAQAMQLELEAFAREHKLAMSSINIVKLISDMFDKSDAWARAKRDQLIEREELLGDTTVRPAAEPAFFPIGSGSTSVDIKPAFMDSMTATPTVPDDGPFKPPRVSAAPIARAALGSAPVRVAPRMRWPSRLWLVGAVIAGAAAVGAIVYGREVAPRDDQTQPLTKHADRIASLLDGAARAARSRVDSLALTPMLRAAIDTDAATIHDLAEYEGVLPIAKHEAIEIFQVHGGASESALRRPETSAPLPELAAGETRLQTDGHELAVVAAAAVRGRRREGVIALRVPVDLAATKQGLEHQAFVSLAGAGSELVLAGAPNTEGKQLSIPVATSEVAAKQLTLVAVSARNASAAKTWLRPARDASIGLAGLFLLIYTIGVVGALRRRT